MRIGVVGSIGPDRFAQNIADALGHMGHVVTQLGPAHPSYDNRYIRNGSALLRVAMPGIDERTQARIANATLHAECDIVINVDLRLMPETVSRMQRAGVRTAFWFPDAVSNLGRQLMVLAPYDALFFKEPHIVGRLRANLGLPVHYLPEACNARWHRPFGRPGNDPYLVVAGNSYPTRLRLLERLTAKGIPVKLYGAKFAPWIGDTPVRELHAGRLIFREEKAKIFRSAAGVLNTMHPAEISGVNVRLFEAAGCGAAVLSEFRPMLPELFDIGGEILAFNDFDELVHQAARLLNDEGLSEKLGNAASRRAHSDHTYEKRLLTILEKLS